MAADQEQAHMNKQNLPGALVVGGEHPGLAITRSLGRRGIPVVVVDDQVSVSKFSRFAERVVSVGNLLDERKTVDSVLEIGKKLGLDGWVLFPTRDENVAAFSRYRSELVGQFRVTTPEWETVKFLRAGGEAGNPFAAHLDTNEPRRIGRVVSAIAAGD
jgi:predicted ATP-grasp superfamily ATP-dependent carboligase